MGPAVSVHTHRSLLAPGEPPVAMSAKGGGLHRSKGGPNCEHTEPTEREGFALAVGAVMQWTKLRDSSNPMFFTSISEAVRRCEGTERCWSNTDMTFFVMQRLFGGIPQYAVEKWIQHEFMGVKGKEAILEKRFDVISSFAYKYLSTVNSGVDFTAASELAEKANVSAVLRSTELGGCGEFTVEQLIEADVWDINGGKAGLKEKSKELLTMIAARGRKINGQWAPINPHCSVCKALKYMHMGDRCKIQPVPCKCDGAQPSHADTQPESGSTPPTRSAVEEPPNKRHRGFSDDLDPNMYGIFQTFERKCTQLDMRFSGQPPKQVVRKLLGRTAEEMEMDSDDEGEPQSSRSVAVTGEQGGRLLVCFLVRAAQQEDPPSFLDDGVLAWLNMQVPKVQMYPAAKLCLGKAIKFLPKLERCLALQEKARKSASSPAGPDLDFGSDSD